MMGNHVTAVVWTLTATFISLVHAQSLPYNPTAILIAQSPSHQTDTAYVFLQGSTTHEFVSVNISSTISTSNLVFQSLSSDLPFLKNDTNAFIPSISPAGEISVYAGSCSTSTSSQLWQFTPSNTSSVGNGTWAQQTTYTAGDVTSASLPGADFLAQGFSFSTLVDGNASETDIYAFGGMCPNSSATTTTWQSAAAYSSHMLRLSPASSDSNIAYTLDLASSRGGPIAEAGFTITGLTPSYSNGSGVMTQSQNFVLVGGHTQTAFINMSQVAIWSLPEESWSFVTVDSPSTSNGNTELAIKSTATSVDSRSGHTAVLSEDGASIIVFGGWVGGVDQAADPQLAVLSLGTGFGGSGDWTWSIPTNQPTGGAIYGHGAVMLPGNVMMVLGGYNISSSTTSKRATSSGAQAMFFNATSMTWGSSYTNPSYTAAQADSDTTTSGKSSSDLKIGLGLGLGLGLLAIICAIIFYFWYSRRLRREREEEREKDIADLGVGGPIPYRVSSREMGQRSGAFPWANNGWNNRNEPVFDSNSAVAGYENLNTGIHGSMDHGSIPPPPRQILRKPVQQLNARGSYQPTPTFDFNAGAQGRTSSLGTAGPIHPIYEADEDDFVEPEDRIGVAIGEPSASIANRYSDPFKDPPPGGFNPPNLRTSQRRASSPEAESPAQSREREVQEWVSDWAAADALLTAQTRTHSNAGRLSPTRRAQLIAASYVSSVSGEDDSGRTASNLSERSIAISAVTVSRSGSSSHDRSRSNSLRGFITGFNPFASSTAGSTSMSPVFDGPGYGSRGLQPPRSAGSGSSHSFNTARTSFPALQAEGESLLPRPDDEFSNGEHSPTRSQTDYSSSSPSKHKPSPLGPAGKGRSQMGWLGSIRGLRKLVGAGEESAQESPHTQVFASGNTSPVRIDQREPRRTVSAGATLWRRKQGRGDWEDSANPASTGRSNTFTGDLNYPPPNVDEDDEDWDVEQAVQNRVVQVMFTVPKEKLRVVNHDFEEDKSEVGSLRSKKGSMGSRKKVSLDLGAGVGGFGDIREEVEGPIEESPVLGRLVDARVDPETESLSPSQKGKGKGKVAELVEMMEGRSGSNSPERY